MANVIASQIIPSWAVSSLGKKVRFVKDYDFYGDGSYVYQLGKIAVLDGLQRGRNGVQAIVCPLDDDSLFLNPPFDYLELVE
jgi:hypothetical protein